MTPIAPNRIAVLPLTRDALQPAGASAGIALLAVLFALVLLLLLALPFTVSMSVGADAATREVETATAAQASASVRDLLLADAALSDPGIDPTPGSDDAAEWPDRVDLPTAFRELQRDGRIRHGGEVYDLQRFVQLDGVSPMLLTNLLGSTARLREDLTPDAATIAIEGGEGLPDQGFVWVDHELIRYGQRQGNNLGELTRGFATDQGFLAATDHTVAEGSLVLDYRCVLAASWPFTGRGDGSRQQRRPFASAHELVELATAGFGGFTPEELDVLTANVSADVRATQAPVFGRPERVFEDLAAGSGRTLVLRSALHVGPGSTVRLRDLKSGAVEYGLVMSTATTFVPREILLPSTFELALLHPVRQSFPAIDTVVEPLVPAPVNVNTASVSVLTALCAQVRRAADVRVHEADGRRRSRPPQPIGLAEARGLAERIAELRGAGAQSGGGYQASGSQASGALTGFEDLVKRVIAPRLEQASDPQRQAWIYLYRNLLSGRDSALDMGTAPIGFASGPLVGYRAGVSLSRSPVAPGVAARHERSGLAVAMPGLPLQREWATQELLEEAFRLDQRAPYWMTAPVNTGPVLPNDLGNNPASRFYAQLVPMAFPSAGFGQARYPSTDRAEAAIALQPSVAPVGRWQREIQRHESFAQAIDPRGHDVQREGAYLAINSGPSAGVVGDAAPRGQEPAPSPAGQGRHDRISFPFSVAGGFAGRFGASFWTQPEALGPSTLFDYGDGDPERNRIGLLVRDGRLVFEVLDEAGLDPNPGASPAGIDRTAASHSLPLAELGLPSRTPMHVSFSAYGNRPGDLSFAVDGMTRGKPRFLTYLAAALPAFDPNLAGNNTLPGVGAGSNDRWVDVQVESTEGFPPVGILRIGTELFEYSSIQANTFRCRPRDSVGQRMARQAAAEFRPSIPTDANGRPTVDIRQLQNQGINLDVAPAHPVGSAVELYGYNVPVYRDTPLMVGKSTPGGALGAFAVARGYVRNPRPIQLTIQGRTLPPIGQGIDVTWTGDLELANPIPSPRGSSYPPDNARQDIADAFDTGGGYALLVQAGFRFDPPLGVVGATVAVGGIEVIKYASRQGTSLKNVQRAALLPGNNALIQSQWYDGQAHNFVCQWTLAPWGNSQPPVSWDEVATNILWVVPVSLPVQNPQVLADPSKTGTTEWLQLLPQGDTTDTEWVRYDAIVDGRFAVRGNRAAWDAVRFQLTNMNQVMLIQLGPLGPNNSPATSPAAIWGTVTPTSGFIGYTPQLEADYPQIRAARNALAFRGDPRTGTSSHPHPSATVLPCHRMELNWGNFGASSGRAGRHDRIALIQGSTATGTSRPLLEWHTVNWSMRRFDTDNLQPGQQPSELLGPWPFQLVGLTDQVRQFFMGPRSDQQVFEPRQTDRMVKFPSGELPAAYAADVPFGAGVGNSQPMAGIVDEIEVVQHFLPDLVVDEPFDQNARSFRIVPELTMAASGPIWQAGDRSAAYPPGGGLLWIDGEIIAYQSRADGQFQIAADGRGLLNTQPRGHDRGARVCFLTHRPAAILAASVQARSDRIPLQALGAMPPRGGTALLGRQELLHWTWTRIAGDTVTLEMPRWNPPGEDDGPAARGLFRGRYGTAAVAAGAGAPLIAMPFRHWDRYVPRNDDPEQSYFQMTWAEAPVWFRSVHWQEETTDANVDVECLLRVDQKAPWTAAPGQQPGFWRFDRSAGDDRGMPLRYHGSQLEARFAVIYQPGSVDLQTFRAHGWKTTPRVKNVRIEYEGQGRVLREQVTAR